jgi:hypothetical protein
MSNFSKSNTLAADGSTDWVSAHRTATLSAQNDFGGGTLTWKFKGPDGVEQDIYGGATGETVQAFTAPHMITVNFGGDVKIRGTLASSTSPDLDWQIIGNSDVRG